MEQTTTASQHRAFSPGRVFTIAANTLTELARQRVFYVLLIFGLILIASSVFMARFSFQQEFQILKDVSFGTISIFSSLLAVIATARLISQDVEDRTIYTILAKPVPRFEYVLGKLGGVILLLAISIAAMSIMFAAVLYFREQAVLAQTTREITGAPSEQVNEALNRVSALGLNTDVFAGIAVIFLKACLLAALTLLVSTFATTNIFTIAVFVCVYLIGHLQPIAREYWLQQPHASWVVRGFLAVIALIFPDLQAFNLVDDIVAGVAIPAAIFTKTALLGLFYIMFYTVAAVFVFYGKEL